MIISRTTNRELTEIMRMLKKNHVPCERDHWIIRADCTATELKAKGINL